MPASFLVLIGLAPPPIIRGPMFGLVPVKSKEQSAYSGNREAGIEFLFAALAVVSVFAGLSAYSSAASLSQAWNLCFRNL
jgi:hypothetical protein